MVFQKAERQKQMTMATTIWFSQTPSLPQPHLGHTSGNVSIEQEDFCRGLWQEGADSSWIYSEWTS